MRALTTVAAVVALGFGLSACKRPEPAPLPSLIPTPANVAIPVEKPTRAQLVTGALPAGADGELARVKCVVCHSDDYLVTQRLTSEQWSKEIAKMRDFGAKLDDAEAARLSTWLASLYTADLPDRPSRIVGKAGEAIPDWRVHAADAWAKTRQR